MVARGGYTIGAGNLAPYNGKPLASRGAVVVTVNYRLGHLGFFAHPALDKEYPASSVVNNFGLLDQIAALQWVQRNIPAFGGDRRNVTLFGESSGARSVLSLCCSPLTEGLFHKGIVQSAYSLPDTPRKRRCNRALMSPGILACQKMPVPNNYVISRPMPFGRLSVR